MSIKTDQFGSSDIEKVTVTEIENEVLSPMSRLLAGTMSTTSRLQNSWPSW
jgi:hypothetical protein